MHAFNVFLGGTHTGSDAEFLQTMRHYMPTKHRDFLEALTHQPSVREYVKHYKDRDLMAGYNGAVEALAHKTMPQLTLVKSLCTIYFANTKIYIRLLH